MTVEGDLEFYFDEMNELLADDFTWELSGSTLPLRWESKSEFLDSETGLQATQSGAWDAQSWLIGANIAYNILVLRKKWKRFYKYLRKSGLTRIDIYLNTYDIMYVIARKL